jgi:hypothetical protein
MCYIAHVIKNTRHIVHVTEYEDINEKRKLQKSKAPGNDSALTEETTTCRNVE